MPLDNSFLGKRFAVDYVDEFSVGTAVQDKQLVNKIEQLVNLVLNRVTHDLSSPLTTLLLAVSLNYFCKTKE